MSQLVMAALDLKKYNPRNAQVQTTKIRVDCQTDILFFKNNEFDRIGIRFFVVFSILFSLFIHLPNNPENTADIIYIFCYEIPSWALIFYYIFDTIYDIV